jgi:hypothetical protein
MRFALVLLVVCIGFVSQSVSQNSGSVEIIQDARISTLVEKHIQLNEIQKGVPGFRVQIFFASGNNSKPNANKIKSDFLAKYPRVKAYVIYQEPYYKVRVGDFRSRLEAQGFLNIVTFDFPSSYIVSDEIQIPEISP